MIAAPLLLLAGLLAAGPIVGEVTHESAIVWIAALDREAPAVLEVWPAAARVATGAGPSAVSPVESGDATVVAFAADPGGRSARAIVRGLSAATRYEYAVVIGGARDPLAAGSFTTAPPPGAPFRAMFAVTSCMQAQRDLEQRAFRAMAAESPALLIQLGDTHYANTTNVEKLWEWNLRQRGVRSYADLLRVTPTLTVWDDHDYGANNSDGTLPGKERSLAAFGDLWPNPRAGLPDAPGVFFQTSFGDVDIFLLDERYHRSPNAAPDDERKRMLGEAQFRWLEDGLARSRATFKIVAGGSTLEASQSDGWRLYSRERERLMRLLGATEGAIRLSGDVHRSFVSRFPPRMTGGHALYEVISSGVALRSSTLPDSFAVLEVDTTARDPRIDAVVINVDPEGAVRSRARTEIRLSELRPW